MTTRRPTRAGAGRLALLIATLTLASPQRALAQPPAPAPAPAPDRVLPRIRFTPPPSPPSAAEITVRVDGNAVELEDIVQGLRVEPGVHVVTVDSEGYEPWTMSFEAPVPLTDAAPPIVDVTAPPLRPNAPVMFAPPAPPQPRTTPSRRRPFGFALMGIGAIGMGAGTIFGLSAISSKNDARCNGVDCSGAPAGSGDTLRDAQRAATLSTISFAGGALLVATGLILFFVAPSTSGSGSGSGSTASSGGTF